MKSTLLSVAVAAALSLSAVAHAAPAAQDNEVVPVPAPATARYHLYAKDFDDYKGSFALSNGDSMKFFAKGYAHYYAQVWGNERVELTPVSRTEFVTPEGARVRFNSEGTEVTISNYERLQTAQQLPANTTIVMARR